MRVYRSWGCSAFGRFWLTAWVQVCPGPTPGANPLPGGLAPFVFQKSALILFSFA